MRRKGLQPNLSSVLEVKKFRLASQFEDIDRSGLDKSILDEGQKKPTSRENPAEVRDTDSFLINREGDISCPFSVEQEMFRFEDRCDTSQEFLNKLSREHQRIDGNSALVNEKVNGKPRPKKQRLRQSTKKAKSPRRTPSVGAKNDSGFSKKITFRLSRDDVENPETSTKFYSMKYIGITEGQIGILSKRAPIKSLNVSEVKPGQHQFVVQLPHKSHSSSNTVQPASSLSHSATLTKANPWNNRQQITHKIPTSIQSLRTQTQETRKTSMVDSNSTVTTTQSIDVREGEEGVASSVISGVQTPILSAGSSRPRSGLRRTIKSKSPKSSLTTSVLARSTSGGRADSVMSDESGGEEDGRMRASSFDECAARNDTLPFLNSTLDNIEERNEQAPTCSSADLSHRDYTSSTPNQSARLRSSINFNQTPLRRENLKPIEERMRGQPGIFANAVLHPLIKSRKPMKVSFTDAFNSLNRRSAPRHRERNGVVVDVNRSQMQHMKFDPQPEKFDNVVVNNYARPRALTAGRRTRRSFTDQRASSGQFYGNATEGSSVRFEKSNLKYKPAAPQRKGVQGWKLTSKKSYITHKRSHSEVRCYDPPVRFGAGGLHGANHRRQQSATTRGSSKENLHLAQGSGGSLGVEEEMGTFDSAAFKDFHTTFDGGKDIDNEEIQVNQSEPIRPATTLATPQVHVVDSLILNATSESCLNQRDAGNKSTIQHQDVSETSINDQSMGSTHVLRSIRNEAKRRQLPSDILFDQVNRGSHRRAASSMGLRGRISPGLDSYGHPRIPLTGNNPVRNTREWSLVELQPNQLITGEVVKGIMTPAEMTEGNSPQLLAKKYTRGNFDSTFQSLVLEEMVLSRDGNGEQLKEYGYD